LETKLSEKQVARHHYHHSQLLQNIPFVQLVKMPGVLRVNDKKFYVVSASRFLSGA
jgi:hypothetical protein